MSLLPFILDQLEHPTPRPTRLINQHFGHGLTHDDLNAPMMLIPRELQALLQHSPHYYRPWRHSAALKDAGSQVSYDKEKFMVNLDVAQFAPEEISVKVTGDNTITIEGKHEEKPDEHGFISRHFVRRYIIPKGHDIDKIQSKLSSDGVLTIIAPKIGDPNAEHKHIPIEHTGKPSRLVKQEEKADENGAN